MSETHLFEQNPNATQVRVCTCGRWPDHHVHGADPCGCDTCRDEVRRARWTNPDTGLIVAHPYDRSPQSGAGNCWCGRHEDHRLHIGLIDDQPATA